MNRSTNAQLRYCIQKLKLFCLLLSQQKESFGRFIARKFILSSPGFYRDYFYLSRSGLDISSLFIPIELLFLNFPHQNYSSSFQLCTVHCINYVLPSLPRLTKACSVLSFCQRKRLSRLIERAGTSGKH